jgi:hypothetical protein
VRVRDDLALGNAVARFPQFLIATLAIVSLLACASQPPKARTVLTGNAARNLLILRLNTTAIMSPELEPLSDSVWSELEIYLRAEGAQLRTAPLDAARRIWLSSIQQARAGKKGPAAGFDDAARLLVLELAKHADFDTVIVPSLFIREASISGNTASWDGVERELLFEQNGSTARYLSDHSAFVGVAPAASLHAVVLDADGNKLQDSIGGLELLVRVRAKRTNTPANREELDFAPHTGPFANSENIREGIARALAPYFLPPLPSQTE